jgi:serine/threonine-protein kinase HipA
VYRFNDMIGSLQLYGIYEIMRAACDIVSTLTYLHDTMALGFNGTKDPKIVDTARLRGVEVDLKGVGA